jgi:signal transduction histidine kinase
VLFAAVVVGLVPTLAFSVRNRSFDEEPFFIPVAVTMILGYSTVGAILSSRTRGNPIGWLLLGVGAGFLLTGLTDEYLQWLVSVDAERTTALGLTALLTTVLWMPMIAAISLLMVLFPSGAVPGRRWRTLPWVIIAGSVLFLLGSIPAPGTFDPEEAGVAGVANPLGVEALRSVASVVAGVGTAAVLLCVPLALAAPLLRYRRAAGEERQQIRWLAYVVAAIAALVVLQIAVGLIPGEPRVETLALGALFLTTFVLIGIGLPVTIALAVLRYRLYELDVVVKKTVVFGIVVVLLTAAFLVAAGIVGGLVGRTTGAAIAAAFVVGALVAPTWRVARAIADRVVYGGRTTPYEALTEFSDRLSEAYATDDVLPRMATVLGESTRAATAVVWVHVGEAFRASAAWPGDAPLPPPVAAAGDALPALPGDRAVEVRHRGELLGALTVVSRPDDPVEAGRTELMRGLAAQGGLVLRNVRLIEELRESRRRIVAAQDERAKKLERNIHDGAQQQLVALAVKTRLAAGSLITDPDRAAATLEEIQRDLMDALEDLRDLARGIYPPLLADKGLPAALEAQARKVSVPVTVRPDGVGRYPQDVEAAVYFSCLEALQNVAKYADASSVAIILSGSDRSLSFTVEDDGRGFDTASTSYGTGLQGIADRLDAIGGHLSIDSEPGRGTRITGSVDELEART